MAIFLAALAAAGIIAVRSYRLSQRPNVLLITLDTTRSDRIGCYGYAPALTPTLDALAAEGVRFERAYTSAPLTLPSHASMLTGLYPPEHGLITNGRGRLDGSVPTFADTLKRAGYDTAAFVGSFVLHSKFGLARGFDVYDDDMTNTEPTEHGLHRQRDGKRVVDLALNWLSQPRKKPFLCWVHLYDAHFPYQAHADEFGDQFADRPYDGELAYIDRQVRRLIEQLDRQGLRKKTLIIVVGDHGESLGEHDEDEHSLTLYDATLRVPWIWAGYGVTSPGKRLAQNVSLVDLAPTVLEVLGQRALPGISGRSLRPALVGQEISGSDCYAMSDDPLLELGCSPIRSLATSEWKYIRSTEPELYDLTADPHELKNLAAEQPERLAELESRLASLEKNMRRRSSADVQLSPREQRALESLGYLGEKNDATAAAKSGEALPDIKRLLPLDNRAKAALRDMKEGRPEEAERQLRQLAIDAPAFLKAKLYLAKVLNQLGKYAESRDLSHCVLSDDPESFEARFELGTSDLAEGHTAESIQEFNAALLVNPLSEGVWYSLGQAHQRLGHSREAERCFREVLDLDPTYVDAHIALGIIFMAQSQSALAESHFLQALDYAPQSVGAHGHLAILLTEQGRTSEAGTHFRKAAEFGPLNAEVRFNYGTYLMTQGRLRESQTELEAAICLEPGHAQARQRLERVKQLLSQRPPAQ